MGGGGGATRTMASTWLWIGAPCSAGDTIVLSFDWRFGGMLLWGLYKPKQLYVWCVSAYVKRTYNTDVKGVEGFKGCCPSGVLGDFVREISTSRLRYFLALSWSPLSSCSRCLGDRQDTPGSVLSDPGAPLSCNGPVDPGRRIVTPSAP